MSVSATELEKLVTVLVSGSVPRPEQQGSVMVLGPVMELQE